MGEVRELLRGELVRLCWGCGIISMLSIKSYMFVRWEGKLKGFGSRYLVFRENGWRRFSCI